MTEQEAKQVLQGYTNIEDRVIYNNLALTKDALRLTSYHYDNSIVRKTGNQEKIDLVFTLDDFPRVEGLLTTFLARISEVKEATKVLQNFGYKLADCE